MGEITDRLLPGSLLDFGWVGVVRDGRFFVMSGWAGEELYVANPDGAITQRIGRSGQGPGEYRAPHYVLDTDSFFVVLDPSNARATHLSKDRFRVVHTTRLPASLVSRPVALRGNDYAINGIGRGSAESDPIHVIAGDGTIVRSFGADRRHATQRLTHHSAARVLAAGRDGSVWVGFPNEYRIEKWDSTGRLSAVYERTANWFPPRAPDATGHGLPRITAIHEDASGLLWVEIKTIRPPPGGAGRRVVPADHSLSETYVEVLDLHARSVIAARRFTGWFPFNGTGGLISSTFTVKGDEPLVQVWTYELHR